MMKWRVAVTCVIKKGDEYLFGKKKPGVGPYPDTWHLMGGGIDLENENLEEAIFREIKEESGVTVNNLEKITFLEDYELNKHGEMTHFVFLVFQAEYVSGEPKAGDDIVEVKWFHKKELKTISLPRPSTALFKHLRIL